MSLNKEEYNEAVGILKRYNYNLINISNIQSNILSLSVTPISNMPRASYGIMDTTARKVIEMEENEELQKSIKECKVVIKALQLVDKQTKTIFEELYQKRRRR